MTMTQELFTLGLARFICHGGGEDEYAVKRTRRLIRKIDKNGDFALPSFDNGKVWAFLSTAADCFPDFSSSSVIAKANEFLVWPLRSARVEKSTLFLRLDRGAFLKRVISSVVKNGIETEQKEVGTQKPVLYSVQNCELLRDSHELSKVRVSQVCAVVARLLHKCGHLVDKKTTTGDEKCIIKTGCSDAKHLSVCDSDVGLQVGHTVDGATKRIDGRHFAAVYSDFYRALSSVAEERDDKLCDRKIHLATSAEIQFQLLAKQLKVPVTLDPSKRLDASFVLYNNARIVQIFRAFRQNYPPEVQHLPDVDEVDFTSLVEDEEWDLVFHFVLPYADYIESFADRQVTADKLQNVNKICSLLLGSANCFSKYYRRVRILRDPQPHLLTVMYARLYLILALRIVNEHAFDILGIRALKQM